MPEFPQHGVHEIDERSAELLFPARRVFSEVLRRRNSLDLPAKDGIKHPANTFAASTERLEATLAELGRIESQVEQGDSLALPHEVSRLAPIFVDMSFVLLRRLADHMIEASRPLFFEHWMSAPQEMKNLRRKLSAGDQLTGAGPLVDIEALKRIICEGTDWFDLLRGADSVAGTKGLRDSLEHRLTYLVVNVQRTGSGRPRLVGTIYGIDADTPWRGDVFDDLRTAISGFCQTLTALVGLIAGGGSYEAGDRRPAAAVHELRFWPRAGAS